jgi:hypothetical protein
MLIQIFYVVSVWKIEVVDELLRPPGRDDVNRQCSKTISHDIVCHSANMTILTNSIYILSSYSISICINIYNHVASSTSY